MPIYDANTAKFLNEINGNCDSYNCPNGCGDCWNPEGRPGEMCPVQGKGYYCPDENNFACLDWAFGSKSIKKAERVFNSKNNDNVKFGVGTYGDSEAMQGLGKCFRVKHDFSD